MGSSCSACTARISNAAANNQDLCQPCVAGFPQTPGEELQEVGAACIPPGCLEIRQKNMTPESLQVTGPIKKPEMRGMTVKDLESVLQMIKTRCEEEDWMGIRGDLAGKPINSTTATLHDLNYYVILPETVPEGVALRGVEMAAALTPGTPLVQKDEFGTTHPWGKAKLHGTILAEGILRPGPVNSTGRVVEVKVQRGKFVSGIGASERATVMAEETDCGPPSLVHAPVTMSWKEKLSPIPCKPDWFVSHTWSAPVASMLRCIIEHGRLRQTPGAEAGKDSSPSYWICAFCHNPHNSSGQRWMEPNLLVLRNLLFSSKGMVLVLDHSASAFSRLWCLAELTEALSLARARPDAKKSVHKLTNFIDIAGLSKDGDPKVLIDGRLPTESVNLKMSREASFDVSLLEPGFHADIEDGQVSMHEDQICLLNWLRNHIPVTDRTVEGNTKDADKLLYSTANRSIRCFLAQVAWPLAIRGGHRKAAFKGVTLPALIREDPFCTEVSITVVGVKEFSGAEYTALANGLSTSLAVLRLHLQGCPVDDLGLCSIAMNMPRSLEVLQLEHLRADHLGDESLRVLGNNLPITLQELRLGFQQCGGRTSLTDKGMSSLAEGLGRLESLKKLFLNLRDNRNLSEGTFRALASAMPRGLEELQIMADAVRPVNRTLWFQTIREIQAWCEEPLQPDTWITRVERPIFRAVTRDRLEELCSSTRADYALLWSIAGSVLAVGVYAEPLQPNDVAQERPEESKSGFFGTHSARMQLPLGSGMPGLVHSSQRELLLSGASLRSSDIFERKKLASEFRIQAIALIPCADGVVEYGARVPWEGFSA
mmetsp:Transcript_3695/g.8094  ORF Transcript_3695/g.8094 Transcript_3695/m.8094 type:complete len:825 (-) Transcript_3695:93-2567(-)|eukprot:CAMPEP_0178376854 /NCGR_PEP_ID=MMETSP0689_2-20121128/3618_1 /TAXON_ID=160604 /ORGANISM="Amphidinium massartii, Strain CS-259" /LENGTH=824 /DNA_ID=CAMNT_0019996891 /DNA_START=31 /DNA_END=2505 /DNA_ORIENTATION=+